MTITAADADGSNVKTYSMGFLENIWFQVQELSWYVNGDQTMSKGGTPTNYKQFADIEGKTVTNVTYYTTNGVFDYDLSSSNLFVKYQATDEVLSALTGDDEVQFSNEGFDVAITSIPEGYELSAVKFGSGKRATTLIELEDYIWTPAESNSGARLKARAASGTQTPTSGILTITSAGAAKLGENTSMLLTFSSKDIADIDMTVSIETPLDTTAVEDLMDSVKDLNESDWTTDSWAALTSALAALDEALQSDELTQAQLDELVASAVVARDALQNAGPSDDSSNNGEGAEGAEGDASDPDADDSSSNGEVSSADNAATPSAISDSSTNAASSTTASGLTQTGDTAAAGAAGAGLMGLFAAAIAALSSRRRARDK
jgi:hypothetical protein